MASRLATILLLLMYYGTVTAQKQLVIKDADTNQPLAFATAECFEKQWGAYSDSAGRIIIPDSIWKSCTITFSYVGYESITITPSPQILEILLAQLQKKLDDVVMKPCIQFTEERLEVRSRKKNWGFGFGYSFKSNGFIWATYVPSKTRKKSFIKDISYGAKRGNVLAPIRLRFYEINTSTGLPSNEITTEAITIVPGRVGWITEDISKYKIAVTETGIVAAFEMFDAGPKYHFKTTVRMTDKTTREVENYGWTIKGLQGEEVVGFGKRPGSSWFILSSLKNSGSAVKTGIAPQVQLKIKVCKN